jgi:hypothetical protein
MNADLFHGKNLVDVTAATLTLECYIQSTMPFATSLTKGKLSHVCEPNTPIASICSLHTNVGLYVESILKQPELTLLAKYFLAAQETITTGRLVGLLADISKKPIEYMQVTEADYEKLWSMWNIEVAIQMKLWELAKDQSWTKRGVNILKEEDLNIEGSVGLREVLEGADMSIVL